MRLEFSENTQQVIAEMGEQMVAAVTQSLDATLALSINHLRSFDPSRGNQQGARIRTSADGQIYYFYSHSLPPRTPHPGGWADVTSNLVNQYGKEDASRQGDDIVGSLFNVAPYASHLEGKPRRVGGIYWVLAGINPDNRLGIEPDFDISEVFRRQFESIIE